MIFNLFKDLASDGASRRLSCGDKGVDVGIPRLIHPRHVARHADLVACKEEDPAQRGPASKQRPTPHGVANDSAQLSERDAFYFGHVVLDEEGRIHDLDALCRELRVTAHPPIDLGDPARRPRSRDTYLRVESALDLARTERIDFLEYPGR
jgi:hypothetical protein